MSPVKIFCLCLLLLCMPLSHAEIDDDLSHCDVDGKQTDLSRWHYQFRERCYFQNKHNPINKNTLGITNILAEMRREPLFSSYLLGKANQLESAFCIEDRADGCRGYYDYNFNIIAVRSSLELFTKVIIFIHELRHLDQVSRGFVRTLDYDAKEMVRMTFAIEADVNAVLAMYGWRLKEMGFPQVWKKLFDLPHYSDIYEAFREEMENSHNELTAARMAFIQWYQSDWRKTSYSRNSLSGYYDMLDDTKLIQRYDKLPTEYFDNLCILPDGRNYGCHLTSEIRAQGK